MGYQTDFVGYLHIQPALNETEIRFINALSGAEPGENVLEDMEKAEKSLLDLRYGMPRGWSSWAACPQGCCLSYSGGDKANHMIPWLKFLIGALLSPDAMEHGGPEFERFTWDHMLNGMVVGSRRDNRELYSITVRENEVEVEVLWPGVPEWSTYPPLAYQDAIDRYREWESDHRLDEAKQRVIELRREYEADPQPFWS